MTTDEQSVALLQQILQALKGSEMGFHDTHGVRTINIGREREDQSLWYFWNGQAEGRKDIAESAITAFLKSLEVRQDGEYKGSPTFKLLLFLDAGDRQFRLRTGWSVNDPDKTTQAGKALVCAIANMTPDQLRKPITIQVRASETEPKLVFASVSSSGQRIEFAWPSKDEWRPQQAAYLSQAIGKIQSVWGSDHSGGEEEPSPAPQMQSPPPPRPAVPARPTPAGQAPAAGARSRKDLLAQINSAHLHMDDDDKRIVFPKAMSATGKPVQTRLDDLTDEEFARFTDEFLIAWGDSVKVNVGGLDMALFEGDCSGTFIGTMAMCADEDPWKRAKFWANAVDMTKRSKMPLLQQPAAPDTPF